MNHVTIRFRDLLLFTDRPFLHTSGDLRQAITGCFQDIALLHNHNGCRFDYRLPRVRYLVEKQTPHLITFGDDGVAMAESIFRSITSLRCRQIMYQVTGTEIIDRYEEVGVLPGKRFLYKSITPWLALNESNHEVFSQHTL
jgi:hypothetical protein